MADEATRPPNESTELLQKELASHQTERILDQKAEELKRQLEAINPIPKPAPEPPPKTGAPWKIFFLSHLATSSLFLIWHFGMNTFLLCTGGGSLALLSGFGAYKLKKFVSKRSAEKARLAEENRKAMLRRNAENEERLRQASAEQRAREAKERAEKLELAKNQAPISFEKILDSNEYCLWIQELIPELCLVYSGSAFCKLLPDQFAWVRKLCDPKHRYDDGTYPISLYTVAQEWQKAINEQTKLEQEKLRAQEAIRAAAEEPAIDLDELVKKYPAIKDYYQQKVSDIFEEQSIILITGHNNSYNYSNPDKKWLIHLEEESFRFVKMQLALVGFQGSENLNEIIERWKKSQ